MKIKSKSKLILILGAILSSSIIYLNEDNLNCYALAKSNSSITAGTWDVISDMSEAKSGITSSIVNEKLYVIGGWNGSSYLTKTEMYDPETNFWTTKASMNTRRNTLTSAVVDNKIYAIGGYSTSGNSNAVEMYNPENNTWTSKRSMSVRRCSLTSAVVNGKIYAIGGGGDYGALNTVEMYDPENNTWTTKTPMPTSRSALASAVIGEKIYCISGYNGTEYVNTVEVYDTVTDTWETKASTISTRGFFSATTIDGKIYCIGGETDENYINTVEVYDPKKDTWTIIDSIPTKRWVFSSASIGNKVYLTGGWAGSTGLSKTTDVYTLDVNRPDYKAEQAVSCVENSLNIEDLTTARDLVNELPESDIKAELQERLDAIIPNVTSSITNSSMSVDVYVKAQSSLSMSLDTNSVTFDNYSNVEDMEMLGAVNITIDSNLPYRLNAYMPTEITSIDGINTMDLDIFNIKEGSEEDYQQFENHTDKITLKDTCVANNNAIHPIDLKLSSKDTQKIDTYKTVIKFEAEQR